MYKSYKIKNNEDNVEVGIIVPGFNKEDIKVSVDGDTLIVSAKSSESYFATDFLKTFILDQMLDTDNITAQYDNGVLRVVLPKQNKRKEIVIS